MQGISLSLDGKVALITGGARGVGAETVRLFSAAGARVVFNYRQARERAENLMAQCGGPERVLTVQKEPTSPENGNSPLFGG